MEYKASTMHNIYRKNFSFFTFIKKTRILSEMQNLRGAKQLYEEGAVMRKVKDRAAALLIAVLMVSLLLAGCGGGKTEEQTVDEQETEQEQAVKDGDQDDFREWTPFDVEAGQYFKYMTKVTQQDGQVKEGWFTLKVSGDDDDQITIEAEGKSGDDTFAFTVTDSKDNVFGNMMMSMLTNPASQHVFSTIYSPFIGGVWMLGISQGNVKVGNKWSYSADGHSISNEVVDKREYAGVEGYYMRSMVDDELESQVCMAPDFPLALMSYVKMDNIIYESELVEYESD